MDIFRTKYYLLYILLFAVASAFAFQVDFKKRFNTFDISRSILYVFSVIFILLFGLRGTKVGVDTPNYLLQFNIYDGYTYGTDFIMFYVYSFFHLLHLPFQAFLLFMSFLYITILVISVLKNNLIFSSNPLLMFFSFISLFYFQSLGINVIRQGVSLSFFLLFFVNHQIEKRNRLSWGIPCLFAVLFHFTTIIPVIIYFLILVFDKIKILFYYAFYLSSILLSFFHIGILVLEDYLFFLLIDERRLNYLEDENSVYDVGFKPQFVLFNTVFLFAFVYIKRFITNDVYYTTLLKYYTVMSALFFLTFEIPYSDRWGLMSWIMIPIMLAPVFSIKLPQRLAILSVFTLFTIFIFFELYT